MSKLMKKMPLILLVVITVLLLGLTVSAFASENSDAGDAQAVEQTSEAQTSEAQAANPTRDKAWAAGVAIAVVACAGAISMGIAISKSVEGISRQPEAESKIRTVLMLGLVFIETAIIYALIVAILIIFVL